MIKALETPVTGINITFGMFVCNFKWESTLQLLHRLDKCFLFIYLQMLMKEKFLLELCEKPTKWLFWSTRGRVSNVYKYMIWEIKQNLETFWEKIYSKEEKRRNFFIQSLFINAINYLTYQEILGHSSEFLEKKTLNIKKSSPSLKRWLNIASYRWEKYINIYSDMQGKYFFCYQPVGKLHFQYICPLLFCSFQHSLL